MAESTEKQRDSEPKQHEEADEDDYMGDLSQFLPPETTNPSKSSAKKVSIWLFPCNNEVSKAFILYYHSRNKFKKIFKIYRIKALVEIFYIHNRHFVFHCMIKKKTLMQFDYPVRNLN